MARSTDPKVKSERTSVPFTYTSTGVLGIPWTTVTVASPGATAAVETPPPVNTVMATTKAATSPRIESCFRIH